MLQGDKIILQRESEIEIVSERRKRNGRRQRKKDWEKVSGLTGAGSSSQLVLLAHGPWSSTL
jgi:hypothetical protein